jgi:hypothetical protein
VEPPQRSEPVHLFACDLLPIKDLILESEMDACFDACDQIQYLRMYALALKVRDA